MQNLFINHIPSMLSLSGLMMAIIISPGRPGPDFAIIVKNSLVYSRRTAFLTAFGITLGILLHVTCVLLGLGVVIAKLPKLLLFIKCLGACYLLYAGLKGLILRKAMLEDPSASNKHDISASIAIFQGFMTNALNPKCILFFLSLFSTIVDPNAPFSFMLVYGIIIFVEALAWFSFVAFCLSGKRTRNKFNSVGHLIERITGGVLAALGIRLFFTL